MRNQTTANAFISRREKEVLQLVAAGRTSKDIAAELFLSVRTVENHRVNILRKLEARNTAGMLRRAMEVNLL
ncbi:response regulator transcription factor [Filimonas effusa]|uniref:Response regulator transcription factor n=1 Tax=Filimonas effusa TaxID=2508721 RepID=A0A4Q1D6J4_9BACT|nr:LuxR C-terminal-related transcriptional regulator [Filimonas effusa]RXK83277.1 response regulator transcription factor [Filimonas effusa]